jgi:hypothetical protein
LDIQKNGEHGENHLFAADQLSPRFCPALSTHRILLCARRLGQPDDLPLAIYQRFPGSQQSSYFTKASVTRAFKTLAMSYYGLLQKETHILCTPLAPYEQLLGACVILHTHELTKSQIQNILRWKSDEFKMYLHNVPALARIRWNAIRNSRIIALKLPPPSTKTTTWRGKLNVPLHYISRFFLRILFFIFIFPSVVMVRWQGTLVLKHETT